MGTLRATKWVVLKNQIKNTVRREELKVPDIVRFVRCKCKQWSDHMNRMEDHRWVKSAKDEKPNAKSLSSVFSTS